MTRRPGDLDGVALCVLVDVCLDGLGCFPHEESANPPHQGQRLQHHLRGWLPKQCTRMARSTSTKVSDATPADGRNSTPCTFSMANQVGKCVGRKEQSAAMRRGLEQNPRPRHSMPVSTVHQRRETLHCGMQTNWILGNARIRLDVKINPSNRHRLYPLRQRRKAGHRGTVPCMRLIDGGRCGDLRCCTAVLDSNTMHLC